MHWIIVLYHLSGVPMHDGRITEITFPSLAACEEARKDADEWFHKTIKVSMSFKTQCEEEK